MLLVIDCCLRGDDSATRAYYQAYLRIAGEQDIQIVELDKLCLMPLDGEALWERDSLIRAQDFGREQFLLARQFREADEFGYDVQGRCHGFCRARMLLYFSTCGGFYGERHLGYEYVKALGAMLGIPLCVPYILEGLDIDPNKRDDIVTQAIDNLLPDAEK